MVAAHFSPSDEFLKIPPPEDAPPVIERTAHEMAGLYVGDDFDLKPAAAAVRPLQFKANESVIEALEAIGRTARLAFLILGLVAAVFLFNGWSSMNVIEQLRCEQMRAEIGMLKAIGMDQRSLRNLLLTEGLILWVGGTARGLVLGLATGYACAWLLIANTPDEVLTAFACPWWLWLSLLGTTAVSFLCSSLVASRAARTAPPIETLRGS
jgi:ABC-type lipoprotein release transport system permease subunit